MGAPRRTRAVLGAVALAAVALAGAVVVPTAAVPGRFAGPPAAAAAALRPSPPMRQLAAARGIRFGTAVASATALGDPAYADAVATEFDLIVPENHLKWALVHPQPATYDFAEADALLAFADAHGQQVRGHTLAWWNQNPAWLTGGSWTAGQATTLLEDHIDTVVGRYRGRLVQWDVYNEGLSLDATTPWPSVWSATIGFPAAADVAFRRARQADPGAALYYNDFGIERPNKRFAADLALVRGLQQRGAPIDGIGFQQHLSNQHCTAACTNALLRNFLSVDALGLDVAVTELDVAIRLPATAADLDDQATVYRSVLAACLLAPNCHTFLMWGVADPWSWIPAFRPGFGEALPLDGQYAAKPAWNAMHDLLTTPPHAPACTDYATQPAAQAALDAGIEGAPLLDPDGDGTACPDLPHDTAGDGTTTSSTTTVPAGPTATAADAVPPTTTPAAVAVPVPATPQLTG